LTTNTVPRAHVTRQQPVIEKQAEDKFETVLFLPKGEARQGEDGLRTQGYFKQSSHCEDQSDAASSHADKNS